MTNVANVNGVRTTSFGEEPPDGVDDRPVAELLPSVTSLETSGDLGAAIAAMLLRAGARAREMAKTARESAYEAEDAAHGRRIDAMRDAAADRLAGGVLGGTFQVASGVATGAGAFVESAKTLHVTDGASKALAGGDKLAGTAFEFAAKESDVEAERCARTAKQAERAAADAKDDADDAKALLARALDYYAEYVAAKDAATSSAILRA